MSEGIGPTPEEMGIKPEDKGQSFLTEEQPEKTIEIETQPLAAAIGNVEAAMATGNMDTIESGDLTKVLEAASKWQNEFPAVEAFVPENLEISIDQKQRDKDVSAIQESDFFKDLQKKVEEARNVETKQETVSIAA